MDDNKRTISIESRLSKRELIVALLKNKLYVGVPLMSFIKVLILEVPLFSLMFLFSISYLVNDEKKQTFVNMYENNEPVVCLIALLLFALSVWFLFLFSEIFSIVINVAALDNEKSIVELEYGEKITSYDGDAIAITSYFKDACCYKISNGQIACCFVKTLDNNYPIVTHFFPINNLSSDEILEITTCFPFNRIPFLMLFRREFSFSKRFIGNLIYLTFLYGCVIYTIM